jgi:hypothetical protein
MKDLSNIAYSDEYTRHKEKIINLTYRPQNKTKEFELIEGALKRVVSEYKTEINGTNYYSSNNKVYDNNGKQIFEYFNLYDHAFFCEKIIYNSGKEYLFYKADLYGYNVFEISTNKTFDYYPKCSFWADGKGCETFIGTDIHFNSANNIFAVGGCYWACPVDTFLLKIDNPLKQCTLYGNTHLMLDGDYDKYDDTNFVEWAGNDIKLKCYNIETKPYKDEMIILKEKDYIEKMIKP